MNIILFGFKGCGKTHFAKFLSAALKRPFIDTDDLIVALDFFQNSLCLEKSILTDGWSFERSLLYKERYGHILSVRKIHEMLGEIAFRDLETQAILQLRADSNAIIALGGGAILKSSHLAHLQKIGQLVYLKISFDTVQKRILQSEIPSFVDAKNPIESLREIYQKRIPIYESIPAPSIDMDICDEAEVIRQLCEIIQKEALYGL